MQREATRLRALVLGGIVALLPLRAEAASIVLSGPPVISVGDSATYALQIALDPGEEISGGGGIFEVDGGRSLAVFDPYLGDNKNERGFFTAPYVVDLAFFDHPFDFENYPVLVGGFLGQPILCEGDSCQFVAPYTAEQGPFTFAFFTLTALAPGELQFVVDRTGTWAQPSFSGGPIPLPPGGVYASIRIDPVPEPTTPYLLVPLVLSAIAGAIARSRGGPPAALEPMAGEGWRRPADL